MAYGISASLAGVPVPVTQTPSSSLMGLGIPGRVHQTDPWFLAASE